MIARSGTAHLAARASSPSTTNRSSATSSPAISSLPALHGRPTPFLGRPGNSAFSMKDSGGWNTSNAMSRSSICNAADITRSRRPARIPEACGPPRALPPENTTRSAPASTNRRRLAAGGNSPAASTITGTPRSCATSTTSANAGHARASATQSTAAVRGPIAAAISQASASRSPAPANRSGNPTSTILAPAVRTAWS